MRFFAFHTHTSGSKYKKGKHKSVFVCITYESPEKPCGSRAVGPYAYFASYVGFMRMKACFADSYA